jgi:asparagine N-glycosylation enzyme membrane subunit Stt3
MITEIVRIAREQLYRPFNLHCAIVAIMDVGWSFCVSIATFGAFLSWVGHVLTAILLGVCIYVLQQTVGIYIVRKIKARFKFLDEEKK